MLASTSSSHARASAAAASASSPATSVRRPITMMALPARGAMVASCSNQTAPSAASAATNNERRLALVVSSGGRRHRLSHACRAIEEKRDTTGEAAGAPENLVSEIERLAALRRADGSPEPNAPSPSQNPFQGAASEARLITWPRPQKALLDTALVLGIVAGTSALVFGLNVVLAELATAWYKSH